MLIRPADAADAAALSKLATRTFRATYIPASAEADVEAYIRAHFSAELQRAEIDDAGMTTLLAIHDERLAAYVQLRWNVSGVGVTGRAPAEVARFYVDT